MLADTSDIHALGAAQRRHADDLAGIAAELDAATVAPDAFGSVGAGFLSALNSALTDQAGRAAQLADRLAAARRVAVATADSYVDAETTAGHMISGHAV